ncbi:hypothetical protein R6Q59_006430 [Mikania micrantha]
MDQPPTVENYLTTAENIQPLQKLNTEKQEHIATQQIPFVLLPFQILIAKNAYEKSRRLKIQENERKLKALGIRNIGNSLKSKLESQKIQKSTVRPHFIPPLYMNKVVNQVKLRQAVCSNVSQKVPLRKDNKGEKRKLILVDDDYDEEDDESFQLDHDVQDDESEEMGDMLKRSGTCKRKRITMVTTSTISNERIGDLVHDDHVEDNHIFETQLHKTKCAPKKVSGYTTKAETWKMDWTQRIVVKFNKFGKPVGDEANELAQFLGTLVRMSDHISTEVDIMRSFQAKELIS